jgi:putative intracellular protease/amidase
LPEGGGSSVQANVTVATAKAADYDAVVFMGWKIDAFRLAGKNASEVSTLISEMQAEDKWVTSLCAGNVVLAEHGVLQGKEAATGPHIQRAGALPYQANWTTENPVVVAGKVITGRDDKNAKLFAETLVRELND